MKAIILFSVMLFQAFITTGQQINRERREKLVCKFIKDFIDTTLTIEPDIFVSPEFDPYARNDFFLKQFLKENRNDFDTLVINTTSLSNRSIKESTCVLPRVKILNSKKEFDSVASLHSAMNVYEELREIGIIDSSKPIQKIKTPYIPMEIGNPAFWEHYAMISRRISSPVYFLYIFKKGNWELVKLIIDRY